MPAIPNANPVEVEAKDAAVYDKIWVSSLKCSASDPAQPVRLTYSVAPSRVIDEDLGLHELAPLGQVTRVIPDVFSEAASDEKAAAALMAIFDWIGTREASL